jgi:hypothetical protein
MAWSLLSYAIVRGHEDRLPMARRSDQRLARLLGTVVGAGFCLLGACAVARAWDLPDPGERVLWYGITSMIVGLVAIVGSWWVEDAERIWCRHPARRWRSRDTRDDPRDRPSA